MAIKPSIVQRRFAEVGRIRIGQLVETKDGKMRPAKLDRMRFTSASKPLLEKVAAAYDGQVKPWIPANGGSQQWEVASTTSRIPILVPPQAITQWMESWSKGGCLRRCNGETERLSGRPCLCRAEGRRSCNPHTRLSVMLRDIEGVGVWRLETHGWDAAAELPSTVEFLQYAGRYVEAWLYLKPVRKPVRGRTRDWMVPALEIEGITPGELRSGGRPRTGEIPSSGAPAVAAKPAQRAALPAPADELTAIGQAHTEQDVADLVQRARDARSPRLRQIEAAAATRRGQLRELADLWAQIVAAAPDQRTSQLQERFAAAHHGLHPSSASPAQLEEFLQALTNRPQPTEPVTESER